MDNEHKETKQEKANRFLKALEVLCDHKDHRCHLKSQESGHRQPLYKHKGTTCKYNVNDKDNDNRQFDPYSIWIIAIKVSPIKKDQKMCESKDFDPYVVREIVDSLSARNRRCEKPIKYSNKNQKSLEVKRREPGNSCRSRPNEWSYVSKTLKQCGAFNRRRNNIPFDKEKKDLSGDRTGRNNRLAI